MTSVCSPGKIWCHKPEIVTHYKKTCGTKKVAANGKECPGHTRGLFPGNVFISLGPLLGVEPILKDLHQDLKIKELE